MMYAVQEKLIDLIIVTYVVETVQKQLPYTPMLLQSAFEKAQQALQKRYSWIWMKIVIAVVDERGGGLVIVTQVRDLLFFIITTIIISSLCCGFKKKQTATTTG